MLAENPHISVILPVRNGAKYLAKTLESIFQQTYSHFTLLVLENNSDDGTAEILKNCSDSRLQVFSSEVSLSIEENWARILNLPLAPWMTIISHDDLLYPDFLQEMVSLIQTEPDGSLYTSHFDLIDAEGDVIRQSHPMVYRESGDQFMEHRHLWTVDSFGTGFIMRSNDYRTVGGIPAYRGLYYADDVLWAMLANLKGRICSPKSLYAYRYYRSSSARRVDLLALYDASISYLNYVDTRPYFALENRMTFARTFVERHLNRSYQRFLVNLITSRIPAEIADYQRVKSQLQLRAAQDKRFSVYNPVLRIIELVAFIPFKLGRVAVLYLMEHLAIWMRRFTD